MVPLVRNVIYFLTFIFIISIYSSQSNGCFHETFKDAKSSNISNECEENIAALPFIFNTYSNIEVQAPTSQTSNGLITIEELGLYCLASNFFLKTDTDSRVFVTYFASGTVDLLITFSDTADDENVVDVDVPIIYDNWTTYNFTLVDGDFKFIIFGVIAENSNLVIDSVTYVAPGMNIESCQGIKDQTIPALTES